MSNIKKNDKADIQIPAIWALLSFAVPAAIMTVIMAVCGIAPFGDNTMINDANDAWFESFTGMYRSIVSGEGVFYHLNVGFGSSFYPEFASGLCSPFMFLSFFFGQRSLAAAYSIITVVRTGAAGTAAWYMLRRCTGISGSMSFILSCGYSLCGFAAFSAYYPSVADGTIFFPLLAVGIFCYVQESRPVRLFLFGTLFFITCSRLTLLGIVFSLALYAAFYIRRGSKRQRVYKLAMFAATLFCSAATNAVLVIPVWAGSVYYQNGVFSDIKANDIVSDLCFGGYGTTPAGGMGLCLAGLLMIGFASFMFNQNITLGEKLSAASGAAIIILSHTVPFIAEIALGFGNAGGENISAGFMLALLAVYCTARNFAERAGLNMMGIACPIGIYVLLAIISIATRGNDAFSVIAEAGLVIFACAVVVQLHMSGETETTRLSAVTAAAVILFGAVHCAGAVGRIHSDVTASSLRFIADSRIKAKTELEESYREKNEEVPRFYRTRSTDGITDSVDINRNAVDGLTVFAERLGIMRKSQYGGADNFTEFTDMLFGIANADYAYYTKEAIRHKACSPAYLIGNWNSELPKDMNAFELQNELAQKWFGTSLFEAVEPVEHTTELSSESERYKWTFGNENTVVNKYVLELPEAEHLYMLVPDTDYSYAINSDSRSEWKKACADGIFSVTDKESESVMTVYISTDAASGSPEPVFMAYRGNIDQAVNSSCAEYISYRGSTLRFMFDIDVRQTAITSIPYENGWDITVNGESVKPVELCGGLIGIQLEKGKNSVVMSYTPPYFRFSLWCSAILFAVGLYITIKIEHEAARRRKVRMAFRAVELNISRMTVEQLDRGTGKAKGGISNEMNQSDNKKDEESSHETF